MRILPLSLTLAAGLAATSAAADATATLMDADGGAHGTVTFTQSPNGVLIEVAATDLAPGEHGFHVHETGACTPDFDAAGGHFAPEGADHGFLTEGAPHAGDLPNLVAAEDGTATASFFSTTLMLDDSSLLDADGAAVMIHEGADDYMDMASAGGRFACGVIDAAE